MQEEGGDGGEDVGAINKHITKSEGDTAQEITRQKKANQGDSLNVYHS